MAEERQLNGINVFQSLEHYENNKDKIKENEINLIKDPNEYVVRAEFEALKRQVDEMKKALGGRNDRN